jgi:hypothetical protein
MDQKAVRVLEDNIEQAIAGVIMRLAKAGRIPLRPSRQTMHLMAKAAVTAYEVAVGAEE